MVILQVCIIGLGLVVLGYFFITMYLDVQRLKETVDNIQGELIEIKKLIKKGCKK